MDSLSPLALKKMDRAAASRQKSCNACVRGKRKCDKRTPRCTRCAAKGLECVYQRTPPQSGGSSLHEHETIGSGLSEALNDVPDFDMGFDIESLGTNTTPDTLQTDVSLLDSHMDFSIMDLLSNGSGTAGSELWNLQDYTNKMSIPPVPSPPVQQPIRDMSLLKDLDSCMSFSPIDVHDKRTSIGFIVDYLTNIHSDFARSHSLPFLHPRLYGSVLPRTILSAFCAATAYSSRTTHNKGWVIKLIGDTARDIHREGERASTPAEKLARVQALVLLDTIRVFDGDLGLRAAAEREAGQLFGWTEGLRGVLDELEGGVESSILMTRERPPKTWEDWILLESVRRTVMMAFSFVCMSHLLKGSEPPCDIMETTMVFTASRHLWEAESSVSFYRAWNEKPQYCIRDLDFKDFWQYGRPEDVDDFTRMMLTVQSGPDAMDHFMMGPTAVPVGGS